MALKPCYVCNRLIPSNEYEAHKQYHKNSTKERKLSSQPGWKRLRQEVLEAYDYRCVGCRRLKEELEEEGIQMHVHHIDGNHTNNDPSNLEPRCSDCHPRGGDKRY